ncbi:MAG: GH92 family glycosyl hydrolase [Filimonas sp.]|nr:GH92 family glycosyl hydrolase [Filimonas sp.]
MNKRILRFNLFSLFAVVSINAQAQVNNYLQYVQPMVGTANSTTVAALKHGEGTEQLANTIPAVGTPFGMTQWTPQTRTSEQKCAAPFYYKDTKLSGFRGTHWISGSCMQDYGSVTIMPVAGKLRTKVGDYATAYNHDKEIAQANYYSVLLPESGITAEVTALSRSSMLRFTAGKTDSLYILVTPNSDKGKGFVKVNAATGEITGYNPAHRIYQGIGKPAGFSGYFVVRIESAFSIKGVYSKDGIVAADSMANKWDVGAYAGFYLQKGEQLVLRVGTSFTSIEEARKNLYAEIPVNDFEKVKAAAAAIWENALQKIKINKGAEKEKSIFYTALYHSMQHPRTMNDVSGTYPEFSRSYVTGKLAEGNYYDDFSMWDIYRAQLPLMEILQPAMINDCVRSFIRKGNAGGWLPIFPCWNSYTGAMVGDHAIAFIASAYNKGIRNYDVNNAYRLMRKNAFEMAQGKEYVDGKGRRALDTYLKYGYVPLEDSVPAAFHRREQVSRTLEYAYDDYALSTVAKALHKEDDYVLLQKRGMNYRNVFDTAVGFVNGRYADGSWYKGFTPDTKLSFITEGTPRQYTFYVPQDVAGLAALMGGANKLEAALDSLFIKGEYWHGNEPGHQVPFMYNYTAAPWKTQREVRRILAEEYTNGPGGLSGNDDAGQMSAWYVFAALGFYPVDPVSNQYMLCTPLFDDVTVSVAAGRQVRIVVKRATTSSAYIQSIKLNGKKYEKLFITHEDLLQGGMLEIELADAPKK